MKDTWITGNTGGGIDPVGAARLTLLGNTYKNNIITSGGTTLDDIGGSSPTCGSTCDAGTYGNCTRETASLHSCPSCIVGDCLSCAMGTSRNTSGAVSADECIPCTIGFYAPDEGTAFCDGPCPAGSFVTDDANDTDGFGVTSSGTYCLPCPAGRFNSEPGKGSCIACEKGTTSAAGATACMSCTPGR